MPIFLAAFAKSVSFASPAASCSFNHTCESTPVSPPWRFFGASSLATWKHVANDAVAIAPLVVHKVAFDKHE
jgi:hypothetical protein